MAVDITKLTPRTVNSLSKFYELEDLHELKKLLLTKSPKEVWDDLLVWEGFIGYGDFLWELVDLIRNAEVKEDTRG